MRFVEYTLIAFAVWASIFWILIRKSYTRLPQSKSRVFESAEIIYRRLRTFDDATLEAVVRRADDYESRFLPGNLPRDEKDFWLGSMAQEAYLILRRRARGDEVRWPDESGPPRGKTPESQSGIREAIR